MKTIPEIRVVYTPKIKASERVQIKNSSEVMYIAKEVINSLGY